MEIVKETVNGLEGYHRPCPMRMAAGCWITGADCVGHPGQSMTTVTASSIVSSTQPLGMNQERTIKILPSAVRTHAGSDPIKMRPSGQRLL
jgi:hypothetical protein